MSDVTVKRVEELDYYKGPKAIPGIRFHPAAKELGVTAWGMSVLELEPYCESYYEHDHRDNGQEEVYVVLRGNGRVLANGNETFLETGALVRVPPDVKRKFIADEEGLVLLAIGNTPGKAYPAQQA